VSAGMLFTVVVGDYLIEKEKPKLKRKIKMMMYEKAQEVDLASYDKPDFYNELVLAINEGDKQIERCSTFLKNTFSGIVAFATTGFYFIYKDKCSILFVASSFVVVFLSNKALNRLQYSIRIESNPFERKRDYVKRIYYLGNYAKELRLNPQINKSLYEDFEESNREIYAIEKSNSKKKMLYRYMSTYIGNDFFNDVAYVIYLIIRASISGLPISSVAILYRNFGNLKEGMSVFTNTYPYACETSLYIQKIRDFLASKSDIISEKNFELNSKRTKSLRDGLPRLWRSVSFTQKAVDSDALMMYRLSYHTKTKHYQKPLLLL
jgi:ATP-binding cassette subfamily B protein